MDPNTTKPVLQALLVADHIYADRETGKKVVAGIFHRLFFNPVGGQPREFDHDGVKKQLIPGGTQVGSPYAYISLTNVRGRQPFELRYVDLDNDQALFQAEFDVNCEDPLGTIEIVVALPSLPALKAGVFALELVCRGDPIGVFRIQVQEIQNEG